MSVKLEELTRLNKEAAALATELGISKQTLYLERETSRNLARKVEQLQAVESRVAVLEAQLVEVQLAGAKGAIALEERLAKLDKAVFGVEEPGQKDGKTGAE